MTLFATEGTTKAVYVRARLQKCIKREYVLISKITTDVLGMLA